MSDRLNEVADKVVPAVEIVTRKSAATLISQQERGTFVAVQQTFDGTYSGAALLIFPENRVSILVRAIISDEMDEAELPAMEDEALSETGNVVLNGRCRVHC